MDHIRILTVGGCQIYMLPLSVGHVGEREWVLASLYLYEYYLRQC